MTKKKGEPLRTWLMHGTSAISILTAQNPNWDYREVVLTDREIEGAVVKMSRAQAHRMRISGWRYA